MTTDAPPRHFIVLVPGYMGSLLEDTESGQTVWLDVPELIQNPLKIADRLNWMLDKIAYRPENKLAPAGIMQRGVLYVLPWAKLDHYGRLLDVLRNLGYAVNPPDPAPDTAPVYTFAYDWRQDNRISGRQLGEAVRAWRARHNGAKAWLIGHSNGGIVSRWFIEKEGGKDDVDRLFLMGSPWDGAPKAVRVLREGMEVVGRRLLNRFGFGARLKDVMLTFPSYYQLIPHTNPFLRDENNHPVDPYAADGWLETPQARAYLKDAQAFNRELGNQLSVDTVCFFGRFKPTTTAGVVKIGANGEWERVEWIETNAGDATVPERSAVFPGASHCYAYAVDHGSIYVDPQMQAQLEWELHGKYQNERASVLTDRLAVVFEPQQQFTAPGEAMDVWATVQRNTPAAEPISGAFIQVMLAWYDTLPGNVEPDVPPEALSIDLLESADDPGRYEGAFTAPLQEGIHRLTAVVRAPGEQPLQLEELAAVERE